MDRVPWGDYFDRVEAIRYTGYDADRGCAFRREIERVGLGGMVVNRWVTQSPFVRRLAASDLAPARGIGAFSELVAGMYPAVKTSLDLGAGRLLVLEDDIRFLQDMACLKRALESMPRDFSTLRLSWMMVDGKRRTVFRDEGTSGGRCYWAPVDHMDVPVIKDTGAVVFSRRGMAFFATAVEKALDHGGSLAYCDSQRYYETDAPGAPGCMYVSVPLVACQHKFADRMCRKHNYGAYYGPYMATCGYGD